MALSKLVQLLGRDAQAAAADWHATEPWVRWGMKVVVLLCGGLLLVSLLPINGAVVAGGTVSVEGEYKAVQHLEGGIVSEILVKNGDTVKEGALLARLDDTQYKASLAAISSKVADHAIQEARLIAERDRKDGFALPDGLDKSQPDVQKTLSAQTSLFNTRRTAYLGQLNVLSQRIVQADNEAKGTESQLEARKKERDLNNKELNQLTPLFDAGYVSLQRISPLRREEARLDGEISNYKSEIEKLKAAKAEAEARMAQADKEYSQSAADDLQKVQAALSEERESYKGAADKAARTEIRAPVSGYVHALAVHTQGGVIQPGGVLMQIVPSGQELVIESRLQPKDIDEVHMAQAATVRFASFDSHTTPRLKGKVRKVSAAELADKEGKPFFTAEVEVPASELGKLDGHRLVPGMPAEVYLETRTRTILSYFMKPLADMMARTFRER